MKYIVDIHGEIEGDYDIIKKYDDPKTGKWIEASEDWRNQITWWQCSECGTPSSIKSNFCPNCGADMRGGEQDG